MSNDSIRLNIKTIQYRGETSMYVSITVNSKQYKAIFGHRCKYHFHVGSIC